MGAIRIKKSERRQLVHSIKYIEFYWNLYKKKYPKSTEHFKYHQEVKRFIAHDYYQKFSQFTKIPLTTDRYISRKNHRLLVAYSEICELLQKELKKEVKDE